MSLLISLFSVQILSIILLLFRLISINLMTNILRFSYAFFLLFSGFVKIIDPLGFSYKLQEYFEVFGMEWLVPLSLFFSVFVCVFELFLGLFLMCGIHIRKVMWGNLLLMIFFTFLTFFSAYFNKVTDCGCFGDFMKLDPWHSFFKDIHLLFISVVLFYFQKHIHSFFSTVTINRIVFICLILFVFTPIYSLSHLPFIDFRAYKIGANIVDDRRLPDNARKDIYEHVWFYAIDGQVQEFQTSDEPWSIDGAVFKDKVTKLISKGDEPKIVDFDIVQSELDNDVTDSILNLEKVYLVVCYDIEKTNLKGHEEINPFLQEIIDSNVPLVGLSASSNIEIKNKLTSSNLNYPFFLVDQTTLKTMVRSNPGVFLMENGVVVNKWHWRDFNFN
ncbi:MAG: DoxX family protein [Flavobacteriales bacterium]|nr:DoxX family protein [Flavobacteriales bacterium]